MATPDYLKPKSILKNDLPSSIVVFLVALPLCLGIAHASGVPPLAGVASGIVGGLIVAWLSGSHTSVSGPAAGLITLVLAAGAEYGYAGLALVTFLAGAMQLLLGLVKAGGVAKLFPRPVVIGMLVAIGLILILKQIPHAVGYSGDFEGDIAFMQEDGRNTFTEIPWALGHMHLGALLLSCLGGLMLILAIKTPLKKVNWLPGPLLAVVACVGLNEILSATAPALAVHEELLVAIPTDGYTGLRAQLTTPAWELLTNPGVYMSAFTICLIASIETLLCTSAVDSLDPLERDTPVNRELIAQGVGNMLCGLIGGIPITAVIVRGSANVKSGAKSKASSGMHGAWLLIAVLFVAPLMNRIPLAALAAVLLMVGYNLANPKRLKEMLTAPVAVSAPFVATVGITLFSDLLTGVMSGFVLAAILLAFQTASVRKKGKAEKKVTFQLHTAMLWLTPAAMKRAIDEDLETVLEIDASGLEDVPPGVHTTFEEMKTKFGERVQLLLPDAAEAAE